MYFKRILFALIILNIKIIFISNGYYLHFNENIILMFKIIIHVFQKDFCILMKYYFHAFDQLMYFKEMLFSCLRQIIYFKRFLFTF